MAEDEPGILQALLPPTIHQIPRDRGPATGRCLIHNARYHRDRPPRLWFVLVPVQDCGVHKHAGLPLLRLQDVPRRAAIRRQDPLHFGGPVLGTVSERGSAAVKAL